MDVSSFYIKIPGEEGTEIVCKEYDSFHNYNPPIPTHFLREMLGLILNENSFQFNEEAYLYQAKRMETIYCRYLFPLGQ